MRNFIPQMQNGARQYGNGKVRPAPLGWQGTDGLSS